jgi:hypothetical protein
VQVPAQIPRLGPSEDGAEVDVPLDWIYLLTVPSPTGSAPYAAVGVTPPCGFRVRYVTADRGDGRVRLRARARWAGPGPTPTAIPCEARTPTVQLASLGVLRLGDWAVEDVVAPAGDAASARSVVQRVVPDDGRVPALMARWTRPCGARGGCAEGGVCMRLEGHAFCAAPEDPWRSQGQPCPAGSAAVRARPAEGEGPPREVCMPLCDNPEAGPRCAQGLLCLPDHAVCVPR